MRIGTMRSLPHFHSDEARVGSTFTGRRYRGPRLCQSCAECRNIGQQNLGKVLEARLSRMQIQPGRSAPRAVRWNVERAAAANSRNPRSGQVSGTAQSLMRGRVRRKWRVCAPFLRHLQEESVSQPDGWLTHWHPRPLWSQLGRGRL